MGVRVYQNTGLPYPYEVYDFYHNWQRCRNSVGQFAVVNINAVSVDVSRNGHALVMNRKNGFN